MTPILTLLLCGLLDRVRGGWPQGRPRWVAHVATSLAAVGMASLVTLDWRVLLGAAVAGELAWRQDNGWRGARGWVGGDRRIILPLRWGAIWAAPFLPLALVEPRMLAFIVAAPAGALIAIAIAVRLPAVEALDLRHGWPWSELLELPVIGLLLLVLTATLP